MTGVVFADLGHSVICVDNDPKKLEMLRRGESPIFEPGIEEFIERNCKTGRLSFTASIPEAVEKSDYVFIAVGTPSMEDGSPDLRAVQAVAREIGKSIRHKIIVVNKSTVPVGSGELVERLITEAGADPSLFDVVSNPEFLREGSAIFDSLNPDRIVIGAKKREVAERLSVLFAPLDAPVLITDLESAELIKYGSNAFLATKISFINAMSRLCEIAGANVGDVAEGMGMDARIGKQFLGAGLGWGGSCFPKDVLGLIDTGQRLGYDFTLLKAVDQVNTDQTKNFVDRLRTRLGGFEGRTIGLLGLAFKPNTDDIRYAKSLQIIETLHAEGATVRAYDPVAMDLVRALEPGVIYCDGALEVGNQADAVVLVTEWNEFRSMDLEALKVTMKSPVLFDGRRLFVGQNLRADGWDYHTVGSV